jgi:hypothetical protein
MKPSDDFFDEILKILKLERPEIAKNFEVLIKENKSDKEIFLWLQQKSESTKLPRKVEQLLTDLFFSIH